MNRIYCRKRRMNGDYLAGRWPLYFGRVPGTHIYACSTDVGDDHVEEFVRAASRPEALEIFKEMLRNRGDWKEPL